MDRRAFLQLAGTFAGAALVAPGAARASSLPARPRPTPASPAPRVAPGQPAVITPNGSTLPLRRVGDVRVGHLIAEEVEHVFAPGLRATVWGYNGGTPGPTIEAVEGDRLRLYVTNLLPEPTTVHWHGLVLPNGMDGVAGLTQRPIPPGATWVYEFTVRRPGTYMYHPHYDEMTQMALGMMGMFIVHPRAPRATVDRDFALMTHAWKLDVGTSRPDPSAMNDFNVLTFNSRAFPGTQPLLIGVGERVRIRLGNLSAMDHHPIHLHGLSFRVTGTDGGDVPPSAQVPETTVLVPVGSTRVLEFVAEEPGDWAMHCHMTHHVMTQMGHGLTNLIGADTEAIDRPMSRILPAYMTMGARGMGGMGDMQMDIPPNSLPMKGGPGPFGSVDMGGMFTVLKVRQDPRVDPEGWYVHPAGTLPEAADPARMAADGIAL